MPLRYPANLFVDNCRFSWENDCLRAGGSDGTAVLQELLGHDFT